MFVSALFFDAGFQYAPIAFRVRAIRQDTNNINNGNIPFPGFVIPDGADFAFFEKLYRLFLGHIAGVFGGYRAACCE